MPLTQDYAPKKLLSVKNLSTTFHVDGNKIHAVQGISFDIKEKERLGIVGESGCGKSAAVKSILRLLPATAKIHSDETWFMGKDLSRCSEKQLRKIRGKDIGFIFQDPMTFLNPTMKIGKQVIEGLRHHFPLYTKSKALEKAGKLFHKIGISDPIMRLNQYPHELSGGMRQRVMIAMAMITSPQILIADEPTTALDVTIQAQILELLKEIQDHTGSSMILITHDLSLVAGFCDYILVMYGGKIVERASTAELFASPKHPYTKALLASIPRLDLPDHNTLAPIPGSPPRLNQIKKGCSFFPRCSKAMNICKSHTPPCFQISDRHYVHCFMNDPKKEQS